MTEETPDLDYTPDTDRLVRKRIMTFLSLVEDQKRAHEIADAIDSSTDYSRRIANELYDEELIEKSWGQPVVGHPMPDGNTRVLIDNRQVLLNIVQQFASNRMTEVLGKSIDELREFIAKEIAVGSSHPLGNRKVSYSMDMDSTPSAGESSEATPNDD